MRGPVRGVLSVALPMLVKTVFARRPNTFTMLPQRLFDRF
jgi:hypothetical protein